MKGSVVGDPIMLGMADEEVKLHGGWASPFTCRVIWALKLKGIPYEYVEESVVDTSAFLLNYNPVHNKIPVLVHAGKPVCESMIIVDRIYRRDLAGEPALAV